MDIRSWTAVVLDALRILAWPTTVVVLMSTFRHQLRERLGSLRQAELPGGVKLQLDALQTDVRNTAEVVASRAASSETLTAEGTAVTDRLFAVAGVRVDLDRLLRRLGKAALRDHEFATRDLNDIILDLRDAGELSVSVARQTMEFLRLASASFGSVSVSDDDIGSLLTVGSLLSAHVHYRERVASIATEHWGHRLCFHFMHGGPGSDERNPKARWAIVSTILPDVEYNYQLFLDALQRAASTDDDRNWPAQMAPRFKSLKVSRRDFLDIARFRRDQIRRLLREGEGHWWDTSPQHWREYQFPPEWGDVGFNGPVHPGSPDDIADDLLRAEVAVRRMRHELDAAGS